MKAPEACENVGLEKHCCAEERKASVAGRDVAESFTKELGVGVHHTVRTALGRRGAVRVHFAGMNDKKAPAGVRVKGSTIKELARALLDETELIVLVEVPRYVAGDRRAAMELEPAPSRGSPDGNRFTHAGRFDSLLT